MYALENPIKTKIFFLNMIEKYLVSIYDRFVNVIVFTYKVIRRRI